MRASKKQLKRQAKADQYADRWAYGYNPVRTAEGVTFELTRHVGMERKA